ncbi:MAG: hypothetical protein ACRC1Z_19290, partial [Waterburya sp.]
YSTGLEPSYEEKNFGAEIKPGELTLLGSRDGRNHSLTIHQDVNLYLGSLTKSDRLTYQIPEQRAVWLQVAKGEMKLNKLLLQAGDGAAITEETEIAIAGNPKNSSKELNSEFLLFDMAAMTEL